MFRLWLLSGLKLVVLATLVLSSGDVFAQIRDLDETNPWPGSRSIIGLPDDNDDEGDDEGDDCPAGLAQIPKTGQTECWGIAGSLVDCSGTGQDGEYQSGFSVDPVPRFTDNDDGTVTDNLTGLIWLKNASCFGFGGKGEWEFALGSASNLASGACGLSDGSVAGDWRLPNVREITSLIDYGRVGLALPEGNPFSDVKGFPYWSSTTFVYDPLFANTVSMFHGGASVTFKFNNAFIWVVRGGP